MKRLLGTVVCLAIVCAFLLPLTTSATEDFYFLAYKDGLPDVYSSLNTPIRIGGDTYIPANAFDPRQYCTVSLFFAQDDSRGTVTIYSREDMLVFDVNAGTAYGRSTGQTYEYKAVYRNGLIYVPIAAVCRYFGLSCTFLTTDFGPLVRVKDGSEVLDDAMFLSSISPLLEGRMNGVAVPAVPPPNNGNNNPPPVEEDPEEPEEEETPVGAEIGTGQDIYVALEVDNGENLPSLLTTLDQYQIKALIFFQVENLSWQDDLLRQAVGSGHRIGLIPQGETAQEQANDLARGNERLSHIIRQRSWFTLSSGDAQARETLLEMGWICWSANVTVDSQESSSAVLGRIESRTTGTRLMLSEGTPSSTLSSILRTLQDNNSVFHGIRETDY